MLTRERRIEGDGELEDLWLSSRLNRLPGVKLPNANISQVESRIAHFLLVLAYYQDALAEWLPVYV